VAGKKGTSWKWKWSDRQRKIKVPDEVVDFLISEHRKKGRFTIPVLRLNKMVGSDAWSSLATYLERGLNYYHRMEGKKWVVKVSGGDYIIDILDEQEEEMKIMVQRMKERVELIKDIRGIMNEIKTNCLYSESQMAKDEQTFQRLRADENERQVLRDLMLARRGLSSGLIEEAKKLVALSRRFEEKEGGKE